ncbi:hypothetical protein GCM10012287_40660 [Streptomyces daqingensis]|uniref:Uncharacterized protein n=1 Tax=Streptomyces daqingensis TaxID=1472640 RepID=A0ABQ2MKN2_9ACTN|nr:hypothetical protein [Streptomyces daqingensis]GGO53613.1 hypothetical protein GCM10012287_40660 [Streptomyces daqingensis]
MASDSVHRMPKKPWYCPYFRSGTSRKLISVMLAVCCVSPSVSTTTAASSASAAPSGERGVPETA